MFQKFCKNCRTQVSGGPHIERLAMTDYYTRAAIPELVAGAMPAAEAANRLFE